MTDHGRDVPTLVFEWTVGASYNCTKKNQISTLPGPHKKENFYWGQPRRKDVPRYAPGSNPKTQDKTQGTVPIPIVTLSLFSGYWDRDFRQILSKNGSQQECCVSAPKICDCPQFKFTETENTWWQHRKYPLKQWSERPENILIH